EHLRHLAKRLADFLQVRRQMFIGEELQHWFVLVFHIFFTLSRLPESRPYRIASALPRSLVERTAAPPLSAYSAGISITASVSDLIVVRMLLIKKPVSTAGASPGALAVCARLPRL